MLLRLPTCSPGSTAGFLSTPVSGSRLSTVTCRAIFGAWNICCDTARGPPSRSSGSLEAGVQTVRSLASATCCRATRRPTGSDRVAVASLRVRERTAWSSSRRLSFLTGSPTLCRRHASIGIGITECLRRITSSGGPSRRWRSATSASGKRPRPVGMWPTVTPRKAAATRLTHIKSPARTTPHGSPGPSSWPGWARSFRWSARTAAATSG